jgi:hypothetical protein
MTETTIDVDALANEIRRLGGTSVLGCGALAEALMPFLASPSERDAAIEAAWERVAEPLADLADVERRIMEAARANQSVAHLEDELGEATAIVVKAYRSIASRSDTAAPPQHGRLPSRACRPLLLGAHLNGKARRNTGGRDAAG